MRRWWSGQSQQTVNLSALCLRRFKSYPAHNEFWAKRKGYQKIFIIFSDSPF